MGAKKNSGSRDFDNKRQRDFLFLLGWDAGIVKEKWRDTGIKFYRDYILAPFKSDCEKKGLFCKLLHARIFVPI